MDFAELIPVAAIALVALVVWTRHQRKMLDKRKELLMMGDRMPENEDGQQMREEMKYLKDRVATLEQITTDGHSTKQLESEIEQLRGR